MVEGRGWKRDTQTIQSTFCHGFGNILSRTNPICSASEKGGWLREGGARERHTKILVNTLLWTRQHPFTNSPCLHPIRKRRVVKGRGGKRETQKIQSTFCHELHPPTHTSTPQGMGGDSGGGVRERETGCDRDKEFSQHSVPYKRKAISTMKCDNLGSHCHVSF